MLCRTSRVSNASWSAGASLRCIVTVTNEQAQEFASCIQAGGVAVFPADTVYGLACAADDADAAEKLYALKGRRPEKPSAVMFFTLRAATAGLPELGPRVRAAFEALLPGALTLLVANPGRRFPVACGPDPDSLGVRVPALPPSLSALERVSTPVLQSSANLSGGADARRLQDVPPEIRAGADLVLDGGELPGTPSTVVDLRRLDLTGAWTILREGVVTEDEVARALE